MTISQLGRMCQKLGIELIGANSPQAKGRVERGHGAHQDRLIQKMRLQKTRQLRGCQPVSGRALPGAAQCPIRSAAADGLGPGVLSGRRAKGLAGLGGAIGKPLVAARAGAKGARECWQHGHSARASGQLDQLMVGSRETALARTGRTAEENGGASVAQTPRRAEAGSESSVATRTAGRRTGSIRKVCGRSSLYR